MDVDHVVRDFVSRQRQLLALELSSEGEETQSASKVPVLVGLETERFSVGLYGRTVVTLSHPAHSLPSHRFSAGDEVEIRSSAPNKERRRGVVTVITENDISIALSGFSSQTRNATSGYPDDTSPVIGSPPLSVLPTSSVEVNNKMLRALSELEKNSCGHPVAGKIVAASFSEDKVGSYDCDLPSFRPFNTNLDESQKEAIAFSLSDRPITLIHGPPGTGKTTTIAELIFQAVKTFNLRVLATAPSNVAVDNLLERLVAPQHSAPAQKLGKQAKHRGSDSKLKVVRLGHPARIRESIAKYSLDSLVKSAHGTEIVADVRRELQSFLNTLSKPASSRAERQVASREVKALRREAKSRETRVVHELLATSHVVLATNVGAANTALSGFEFDLVVIDEAAQALESSCWIPILQGKRLVLAGDHCQLPPTVRSSDSAVQRELGLTMFERIIRMYASANLSDQVTRMLKVQYRMDRSIADWASHAMYQGKLETHISVSNRETVGLPSLQIIDTAGCGMEDAENAAGSKYNEWEAQLAVQHVLSMVSAGLSPKDIAVITPYNGQVEVLRSAIMKKIPDVEVRTVDGFQGGEREGVVLSLVRSNSSGAIGFLKDNRRLNVAVTRAKQHCCVICDSETVSKNPFISNLIEFIGSCGEHSSAAEYNVDSGFQLRSPGASSSEQKTNLKGTRGETGVRSNTADRQRTALLHRISKFAEHGSPGEQMVLNPELSKFDRLVIHEFAEQLGLGHCSQGVEGVDRRIVLSIQEVVIKPNDSKTCPESRQDPNDDSHSELPSKVSFAALETNSSSDSESDGAGIASGNVPYDQQAVGVASEQQEERESVNSPKIRQSARKPKKRKKGRKGKGKGKGESSLEQREDQGREDSADDMAFLDTQIEMVQNSHGRRVEGRGNYRTIINGILLSGPPPKQPKKDERAVASLNEKLRKAGEGRKKRGNKKK